MSEVGYMAHRQKMLYTPGLAWTFYKQVVAFIQNQNVEIC